MISINPPKETGQRDYGQMDETKSNGGYEVQKINRWRGLSHQMWMTAGTVIQEMMGEQLDVELLLCVYACMYILNSVLLALCLYRYCGM